MTEQTDANKIPNNIELFLGAIFGTYGVREKFEDFDGSVNKVLMADKFSRVPINKMQLIKKDLGKLFVIANFCRSFYPIFELVLPKVKAK